LFQIDAVCFGSLFGGAEDEYFLPVTVVGYITCHGYGFEYGKLVVEIAEGPGAVYFSQHRKLKAKQFHDQGGVFEIFGRPGFNLFSGFINGFAHHVHLSHYGNGYISLLIYSIAVNIQAGFILEHLVGCPACLHIQNGIHLLIQRDKTYIEDILFLDEVVGFLQGEEAFRAGFVNVAEVGELFGGRTGGSKEKGN